MAPPVPEGTIAAFAMTEPLYEFMVETLGCARPVGQVIKIPSCGACGTAVKLNEYAPAPLGTPQELCGAEKDRCDPGTMVGAPSPVGYVLSRVSATRQGDTG